MDNDKSTIELIGEARKTTSFYFTQFPKDATEQELWHHFKKFGDVQEVFISRQRNKMGRRYGFARFKGVEDKHSLEKKLDNIIFGGLKMYVNIPKYGRVRAEQTIPEAKRVEGNEQKEMEAPSRRHSLPRMNQGSYAEVVARNNRRSVPRGILGSQNHSREGSWSSVYLDIPTTGNKWFNDAWVGRLKSGHVRQS
ncbi:hypothetical protein GmHk_05G011997 [Glycine max]|nr:hypothetical protein GmHk_05G011997 [Glycine max]